MLGTIALQGLSAVAGATLMAASYSVDKLYKNLTLRTAELGRASDALKDHYDALERFFDDPAAPERLSDLLLRFSDVIVDEQVAIEVLSRLRDINPRSMNSAAYNEVQSDLDQLRRSRRDLVSTFDRAIGSGIVAMLLQWDSTSSLFEQASRNFTANPGSELMVVTKVVKATRSAVKSPPAQGLVPAA